MTRKQLKIFKNIPSIKTARLTLRGISLHDVDDVYEYSSDPKVSEFLLWTPHPNKSFTHRFIISLLLGYKKGRYFNWGIELDGKMIGTCGFTSFNIDENSAELGYVLNREYWRRGIAVEAARAVIEYGFSQLDLEKITIRYMADNPRSAGVAIKCGMTVDTEPPFGIICKGVTRVIRSCSVTRDKYNSNRDCRI